MEKKGKLATPDWITEGFDSKVDWEKSHGVKKQEKDAGSSQVRSGSQTKGKTFKIRKCPKCESNKVQVMLTGEEGKGAGEWECNKCKWHGKNIEEEELTEDEFMKYLDEQGEEVA